METDFSVITVLKTVMVDSWEWIEESSRREAVLESVDVIPHHPHSTVILFLSTGAARIDKWKVQCCRFKCFSFKKQKQVNGFMNMFDMLAFHPVIQLTSSAWQGWADVWQSSSTDLWAISASWFQTLWSIKAVFLYCESLSVCFLTVPLPISKLSFLSVAS